MDRDVPLPSNVIPIGAALVRRPRGAHAATVQLLECVLERARRGEIVGVAIAAAQINGFTGTALAYKPGSWELLLAAFFRLRIRLDNNERETD